MVAAVIVTVLVALIALEQSLRIAWEDSGPWRRLRFIAYGIVLAVGLAFGSRLGATM